MKGLLAVVFLRARAKVHALQLEDEQLQILDLGGAGIELSLLRQHQRLQGLHVERVEVG